MKSAKSNKKTPFIRYLMNLFIVLTICCIFYLMYINTVVNQGNQGTPIDT